jgi:succinate dehydrogenase hydrophobic anchor subunit
MPKPGLAEQGASFLKHVVPGVVKPIRALWNEVIGFLFLCLAFLGAVSGYRSVLRNFGGSPEEVLRLSIVGVFVVVMAGFGISSFRRARKISRS